MAKIPNDKYYTPQHIVSRCIDTIIETIGLDKITEVIEPSAGNGAFMHDERLHVDYAYDILPEAEDIIHADYLEIAKTLQYKPGRLVLGNPPFGYVGNLYSQFYKASVKIADYVAFILPISQLNSSIRLYEFDLIKSIDLGDCEYSGRKIRCCFNIYTRPQSGILNKMPKTKKLKDIIISIVEFRKNVQCRRVKNFQPDFIFGMWGTACGKQIPISKRLASRLLIKINNEEYRERFKDFEFELKEGKCGTSSFSLHEAVKQIHDRLNIPYEDEEETIETLF